MEKEEKFLVIQLTETEYIYLNHPSAPPPQTSPHQLPLQTKRVNATQQGIYSFFLSLSWEIDFYTHKTRNATKKTMRKTIITIAKDKTFYFKAANWIHEIVTELYIVQLKRT